MKSYLVACAVLGTVSFFLWLSVTQPIIRKSEHPGDVLYVGGEFSHSDVSYGDYRPKLREGKAALRFWGTKDGEWRRLSWHNNGGSGTLFVLRDSTFKSSWFGVERGSSKATSMQARYDLIRKEYEQQSFFDRVPIWRISDR